MPNINSRSGKSKSGYIPKTPWLMLRVEMLASPAFRVLSQSAYRIMFCILIEFSHHGRKENGKLVCTYEDFEAFGVDRHSISPAIQELVALGFIKITRQGKAGNADFRVASQYALTFLPLDYSDDKWERWPEPADEWKRIRNIRHAREVAAKARNVKRMVYVQAVSKPKRRPVTSREHSRSRNVVVVS
jgi:hypothetical protein